MTEVSGRTYFCTAGGGLEKILAEEVKSKLGAEDVCQVSGKVLFRTSAGMDALRQLKSAERLFLLVRREAPVALPAHTCPAKAASLLQSKLLGDGSQWGDTVVTWRRLQGETESCGSSVQRAAAAPRQQRKTDSSGDEGSQGNDGVNGEQRYGKKRKKDGGEADGDGEGMEQVASPPPEVTSPPPGVTFRVNCKLSGPLSRCLTSQDLSRAIGSGLCRLLGWKVELRTPQLEVNVYLSGDHSIVGIPLTRLPLASRTYMRSTGLRSTVAWALGSLASIQLKKLQAVPVPSTHPPPQEPELQAGTQPPPPPQEPELQAALQPTPPPQEPELQAGPQPPLPLPLSSLQLQSTHR
ncbi:hypothetical protein CRUP_026875, partial [Coryphaenoides rupestris]